MPSYTYTGYRSPNVQAISDLLQEPGRIAGQELTTIAQAQARAAEARGQAFGQAATAIGGIPQAMQQQKSADLARQNLALEVKERQRQADNAQMVDQTRRQINGLLTDPNSKVFSQDGTISQQELLRELAGPTSGQAGPNQPPDASTVAAIIDPLNESLVKGRAARAQWEDAKQNAVARAAQSALNAGRLTGDYYRPSTLALAALQHAGWLTPDEVTQHVVGMVEHADTLPQQLQQMASQSTLPPIKLSREEELVNALDPTQILATGAPKTPTNASELRFDAANPNSKTRLISEAALKLSPENEPLDRLLLQAISRNDLKQRDSILETMRQEAAAKHIIDPNLEVLRGLSAEMARARLEQLNTKMEPLDLQSQTRRTLVTDAAHPDGFQYVDSSKFTQSELPKLRKQAADAGLPIVNGQEAGSINAVDTTVNRLDNQWADIRNVLPKGADERFLTGANNTLEKFFQTNPALGAFDTWRTAAIGAIQAVAEQRQGLRLNQVEIKQMQDGLPKITDDVATAKHKLDIIGTLLRSKVQTLLTQNRRDLAVPGGAIAPGAEAPATPPPQGTIDRGPILPATPPVSTPPRSTTSGGRGRIERGPTVAP